MSSESFEARVAKWLSQHGYGFELLVGRAFKDAGWRVSQGELYRDPMTGKSREIDIVARKSANEQAPALDLALVIECKRSPKRPWVALGAGSPSIEPRLAWGYVPGDVGRAVASTLAHSPKRPAMNLLCGGDDRSHGIVAVNFSTNGRVRRNAAFSAVRGAATAATALARTSDGYVAADSFVLHASLYFAVVVLDGQLLELTLDSAGKESLRGVEWVRLLASSEATASRTTVVNVVTLEALPKFLEVATGDFEQLASLMDADTDVTPTELGNRVAILRKRRASRPDI